MNNFRIPIYKPDLSGNELAYVTECLETSWISSRGRFVVEFENCFAERIGVKCATAVSNGTVALHLALLALGVGPGDEVIVPTLTYVASANAIMYAGATPVFVDSLPDTWQIDPADVRRNITSRTRAIMAVHLYGHPCDMDALIEIAREHRLFLVEDCAEAFGTLYKGVHVGTFGDISTFSFFGNKTITTGEGGMVVSNNQRLIERARHLKGQGLAENREYWHDIIGYNYRMTNIQAALGLAQLERADEFLRKKRAIAEQYKNALRGIQVAVQAEAPEAQHSYWLFTILVEQAEQREPLREYLRSAGIETRPMFYPVHTMPMYAKYGRKHVVAEDIAYRGVCLPSWPGMSDLEINAVIDAIRGFYAHGK